MPPLCAQGSGTSQQSIEQKTPPEEEEIKMACGPVVFGSLLGFGHRIFLCHLIAGPHRRLELLRSRWYPRQCIRIRLLCWDRRRVSGRLDPPRSPRLDNPREGEEEENAPAQRVPAHQPAVVGLGKVKVRSGIHLDQQRAVARRQDTQEDAAAEEEDSEVLCHMSVHEPDALWGHDLERRQEAPDPLCTRLLPVRQGLGRDVGYHCPRVEGRGQEQYECHLERHPDPKGVANHAAEEVADGLPKHDARLELAKHGGALHGLHQLPRDGVHHEDVAGGASEDGDELRGLDDGDARVAAGQDANDLRRDPDGRDKGLHDEGETWAPLLDGPARHEQVHRAAEGGAHAEDGELGRRPGGYLVDGASVSRPGMRWVCLVVDVAFHEVKDVEDGHLGEAECKCYDEAGEEDLYCVGRAEHPGGPGFLLLGLGGVIFPHAPVPTAVAVVVAVGLGDDGSILVTVARAIEEWRSLVSRVCCHFEF